MKAPTRVFTGIAAIVVGAVLIHACTATEPDLIQVEVGSVAVVGNAGANVKAGATLSDVAFVVKDNGPQARVMENEPVVFSADGGSVSPSSISTNTDGQAKTTWTAPTKIGTYHITAAAGVGKTAQVTAVVTADVPTTVAAVASTNAQSAVAGTAVANAPAVLVTDKYSNPVSGVSVTFTAASGSGTVAGGTATTDATGTAKPTSWTLATAVGTNTLTASVTASGTIAGNPVTFTATGTTGPASKLTAQTGVAGQTGTSGSNVAVAPSFLVTDANNNPVAGAIVIMKIGTGGGKVLNATGPADSLEFTTNASGVATATGWKLGIAGSNTLLVDVKGTSITRVTVTATANAGPPATIAIEAANENNQSTTANGTVSVAPGVIVKDAGGNLISGASVQFAIASGGGKILASATDLTGVDNLTVVTNASGVAKISGWKVGNPGAQSLTATVVGVTPTLSFTFNATAQTGPAAQIAYENVNENNQTTVANTTVTNAPGVIVKDQSGFVVAGASVSFTIGAGTGGQVTANGTTATTVTVTTDASGVAKVTSWKPGFVGTNTLVATVVGVSPTLSITFTATGIVGTPSLVTKSNSPYAFVKQSTTVGGSPKVIVTDAAGNLVSGATVTWAAVGGTSTTSGTVTSTTTAAGVATFVGSWTSLTTLGNITMTATVTATSSGPLTGGPSTSFTAKVVGAPTQMTATGSGQSAAVGTAVTTKPSITLKDANGDPVPQHSITFTVTSGSSTVNGLSTVSLNTDSVGVAQLTTWQMPNTTGTQNMSATAAGSGITGSPAAFTATATVGAPASITQVVAPGATALVGTTIAAANIQVVVKDAFSNVIPSATVTFTVGNTNSYQLAGTPSAITNGSGVATTAWRIDTIAGSNTLTAAVSGVSSTVVFTVTGTAASASKILLNTGGSQSGTISAALPQQITVKVADQYNNGVSGQIVNFTAGGGNGSVSPTSATSLSTGVTPGVTWTLGATIGTQTLTASLSASPGITLGITATGTSGSPTCNVRSLTLGNSLGGTLASSDCTVTLGGITSYYHGFNITTSASTTSFSATLATSAFSPRLQSLLYGSSSIFTTNTSPITNYYIVKPGTWQLNAASSTSLATGAYTFSTVSNPSITGICFFLVTKGITVSHTLEENASCQYKSADFANRDTTVLRNSRAYQMVLSAGEAVTVHMSTPTCGVTTGSPLCELLEIYDNPGNFLASDQSNGSVTYTNTTGSALLIVIRATQYYGSAGRTTGSYTLTIDP